MAWLYVAAFLALGLLGARLLMSARRASTAAGGERVKPLSGRFVAGTVCLGLAALAFWLAAPYFAIDVRLALLAVLVVGLLFVLLRRGAPLWLFVLIMLVLVSCVNVLPEYPVIWHGFMHLSMVYEIFERGVPPENPLMIGEPLRYMWAHHALIAWLMKAVPWSPTVWFTIIDCVVLLLFGAVLLGIARRVAADRNYAFFALMLALCGPSPFAAGAPLPTFVEQAFGVTLEHRYITLTKFAALNNNQLGILCFSLALWGLVSLAAGEQRRIRAYATIGAGILGTGAFYPPAWTALIPISALAAGYFLLRGGADLRRPALVVAGVVAAASAAILPLMLSFTSGKAGGSAIVILPSMKHMLHNVFEVVPFLGLAALLAWLRRESLVEAYRQRPHVVAVLALAMLAGVGMFVGISIPPASEYKYLGYASVPLAFLFAVALNDLYRRRAGIAIVLMTLILMPEVYGDLYGLRYRHLVTDPVVNDGPYLRHTDSEQDALYGWIAGETPREAVFVDTHLTIPVLGRRQLLIGTDHRRRSGELHGLQQDGWFITAEKFLRQITGVPRERRLMLQSLADEMLDAAGGVVDSGFLEQLMAESQGRPVYVVARDPALRRRFAASGGLRLAYAGPAASVFRVDTAG